jgi:hypothetical protein
VKCGGSEWCDYPAGNCGAGDQQGQCKPTDGTISNCGDVVCGCDGKSYDNACAAHFNGVDTTNTKSCIAGNGGANAACGQDSDCMTGFKCCRTGGFIGSPIACRPVASGAQCPALP